MSMIPEMQARCNVLDTAYQKLSGARFRGRGVITGREEAWVRFCNAGFTLNDLERVIVWLKGRIRIGKRDIGALRFSTLIGELSRFQEELSLCDADSRKRVPTPRDRVLAQARPVIGAGTPGLASDTAKTARGALASLFEAMRAELEKGQTPEKP